jgi:hypothetical protein
MAAPQYVPTAVTERTKAYESPDHVPDPWRADRPGELAGRQPSGAQLGAQGPDQGYALAIAATLRDRLELQPGESADDAIRGCLGIALRRASLFGRAPVIHDLTIAFTMWGFFDAAPPDDLLRTRRSLFEGVANTTHHYAEARRLADMVPEATLRMTPAQVAAASPGDWRQLTGVGR